MDGYEDLIKTASWAALDRANSAVFELQQTLKSEQFTYASDLAFDARLLLTDIENHLRHRFKFQSRTERV